MVNFFLIGHKLLMLLVEKIKKKNFVIFVIRFNCYNKKINVFKMNIFTSGIM